MTFDKSFLRRANTTDHPFPTDSFLANLLDITIPGRRNTFRCFHHEGEVWFEGHGLASMLTNAPKGFHHLPSKGITENSLRAGSRAQNCCERGICIVRPPLGSVGTFIWHCILDANPSYDTCRSDEQSQILPYQYDWRCESPFD